MAPAIELTYIGHATVLIELDGVRIITDPVLRPRLGPLRRHGPVPDPAGLAPLDAVLLSHGDPDHFDAASLRALPGAPRLIVPRGLGSTASSSGLPVSEVDASDRIDIGAVRVTAVPARHQRWPRQRRARPLGYLIEGSVGVYFAGDTAIYPGMAGLAGHVDVALLPVGRWGPPRGPVRLDPSTAVHAAALVGATVAIPIHWGTLYFPGFGGGRWGWSSLDAGDTFATHAAARIPDLDVRVLRPGDSTRIEPRAGRPR